MWFKVCIVFGDRAKLERIKDKGVLIQSKKDNKLGRMIHRERQSNHLHYLLF